MFTGIVEEMGVVLELYVSDDLVLWDGSRGTGTVLKVNCGKVLQQCYLGASIAVNGVCLTVTAFDESSATFGLAPETLRRTNLGDLKCGSKVNLERSATIGDRNSGHFVQGHVDCTGTISKKYPENDSLWIEVTVPAEYVNYIVEKGYIAIDGTSLTVCSVDAKTCTFTFMLVQYTQLHVIIPKKEVGDKVNIEVDVLGKYSHRAVAAVTDRMNKLEDKLDEFAALLKQVVEKK